MARPQVAYGGDDLQIWRVAMNISNKQLQANIHFSMERYDNHELGTSFFVHNRLISADKRVEFFSDRMLYIILRGQWCDTIALNVHSLTKYKIYDVKDCKNLWT
jgi:hypothetical protein